MVKFELFIARECGHLLFSGLWSSMLHYTGIMFLCVVSLKSWILIQDFVGLQFTM